QRGLGAARGHLARVGRGSEATGRVRVRRVGGDLAEADLTRDCSAAQASLRLPAMGTFESLPDRRSARWDLLRALVRDWYRPLADADGVPETDLQAAEARMSLRLPPALREWYSIAGRRQDIWSRQDTFLGPGELYISGETLV